MFYLFIYLFDELFELIELFLLNLMDFLSAEGEAHVISMISRMVIHKYRFKRLVRALKFSPDGKHFAVCKESNGESEKKVFSISRCPISWKFKLSGRKIFFFSLRDWILVLNAFFGLFSLYFQRPGPANRRVQSFRDGASFPWRDRRHNLFVLVTRLKTFGCGLQRHVNEIVQLRKMGQF